MEIAGTAIRNRLSRRHDRQKGSKKGAVCEGEQKICDQQAQEHHSAGGGP